MIQNRAILTMTDIGYRKSWTIYHMVQFPMILSDSLPRFQSDDIFQRLVTQK